MFKVGLAIDIKFQSGAVHRGDVETETLGGSDVPLAAAGAELEIEAFQARQVQPVGSLARRVRGHRETGNGLLQPAHQYRLP